VHRCVCIDVCGALMHKSTTLEKLMAAWTYLSPFMWIC
jgi:uncharacterized Fe-S cluster-containing MiaB family protein